MIHWIPLAMSSVVAFLFFIDDHPVRESICDDIPVFDTCVEKGSLKTITACNEMISMRTVACYKWNSV